MWYEHTSTYEYITLKIGQIFAFFQTGQHLHVATFTQHYSKRKSDQTTDLVINDIVLLKYCDSDFWLAQEPDWTEERSAKWYIYKGKIIHFDIIRNNPTIDDFNWKTGRCLTGIHWNEVIPSKQTVIY